MFEHDMYIIDDIIHIAEEVNQIVKERFVLKDNKVHRYEDILYIMITQFSTGDKSLNRAIYNTMYNEKTCDLLPNCRKDKVKARRAIISDNLDSKIMQLKCIKESYEDMLNANNRFKRAISTCSSDNGSLCGCTFM